jgi:hypothetical protein
LWRVDRWMLEAMVVTLECVAVDDAPPAAEASSGRVLPVPDVALGTTIVHAFELPPLDASLAAVPRLVIAAAGTEPGWRGAALLVSVDGGARWDAAGATALPAVIGEIVVPPGGAPAGLTDLANTIEVELAHDGMTLADADDPAMDAGANLAMVGDELIQFGLAEPLGGNRWRLAHLWRGRRGTEAAIATHMVGDRFVLIARDSLVAIDLGSGAPGTDMLVLAEGAGDSAGPAEAAATITGLSVVPPPPVHLREIASEAGAEIHWVRRSRAGWRWIDGVDAPLGEEAERYLVTIVSGDGARSVETQEPKVAIGAAERGAGVAVTVRQAGSHGLSAPAALTLAGLD